MSNPGRTRRNSAITLAIAALASSVLSACHPPDDTGAESVEVASTTTAPAAKRKAPAKVKPAKSAAAVPRSYELDPDYPLEELPSGTTPAWPAPGPRQDGAPITLRAVRTDGDIVVWGYGERVATSLAFDLRFLDDAGILRGRTHQGQPVSAEAGKWFRVDGVGRAEFPRAQVQLREATITAGGEQKKWESAPAFRRTGWRYGFPEVATKATGDSGLGFAVVGRERIGGIDPGEFLGVLVVALHNGGKVPFERVELELVARDARGETEPLVGAWAPGFGDAPEPFIAPGAWSLVEVELKTDAARVLAATDFTMKVTQVEMAK